MCWSACSTSTYKVDYLHETAIGEHDVFTVAEKDTAAMDMAALSLASQTAPPGRVWETAYTSLDPDYATFT